VGDPGGTEPRFPGYDVLAQARQWDDVTRGVVLARLAPHAGASFFAAAEEATARALMDRLLAQDAEPRVPVFEMVDQRLASGVGDGYRFEDMPEDGEAWRASLARLEEEAEERRGLPFHALQVRDQMAVIDDLQRLGKQRWRGLRADHLLELWLRYCCEAFYSHPAAWNEIGFGGPAYPRGYVSLGFDHRERWEVAEHDALDPVPWGERAEAARRRHEAAGAGDGDAGGAA